MRWHVLVGGVQYSTTSIEELGRWIRERRVREDALVWNATMPQWVPITSVAELTSFFQQPAVH